MTEPPEPRRPEEGGGDETDWAGMEQEAIRDFVADHTPDMQEAIDAARAEYGNEKFDEMVAEVVRRANDPMRYTADLEDLADEEQFEELDDDITLDVLGSGDDIEDGGELTDMLSAWRDDVDSVPPSPGTAPEIIQQIHDFTQEIDSATAPPRSTEGSSSAMSISENAARLRLIAGDMGAQGAYQAAESALNDQVLASIMHVVQGLPTDTSSAAAAAGEGSEAAEIQGAGEHAGSAAEDAIAAVQAAIAAVQQAAEHDRAFRTVVGDVAARHGG